MSRSLSAVLVFRPTREDGWAVAADIGAELGKGDAENDPQRGSV